MDIAKFNKELGNHISNAVRSEKQGDIKVAIKNWVEISELTLNASKDPNIEITYKKMLLDKTEQIINHVKELKIKTSSSFSIGSRGYKSELQSVEEEDIDLLHIPPKPAEGKVIPSEANAKSTGSPVIDDGNLKNMPKGFQEIKPSESFKILTPYDEENVKKRLNDDIDYSIFKKPDKKEAAPPVDEIKANIELDEFSKEGNLICFACGFDKNPSNAHACKNCGTSLK